MESNGKDHSQNWGGKRPGAGRKSEGGDKAMIVSLSLQKDYVDELDEIARKTGESRNAVLRRAVIAFLTQGKESAAKCDQSGKKPI